MRDSLKSGKEEKKSEKIKKRVWKQSEWSERESDMDYIYKIIALIFKY